ncbi:hypothetical protein FQN49_006245, partial [Arthroderma sp. PD_2]
MKLTLIALMLLAGSQARCVENTITLSQPGGASLSTQTLQSVLANNYSDRDQARAQTETTVAQYISDGRPCCLESGSEPSAHIGTTCQYGDYQAPITNIFAQAMYTKCCFITSTKQFNVHYLPLAVKTTPVDIRGSVNKDIHFCNLGLKWHITSIILREASISLYLDLNVDCATYNKSDTQWITIGFNQFMTHAGKFTYVLSWAGPTIYLDLESSVNTDGTVNLHGNVTGTGIIHSLDESFTTKLDDSTLKAF